MVVLTRDAACLFLAVDQRRVAFAPNVLQLHRGSCTATATAFLTCKVKLRAPRPQKELPKLCQDLRLQRQHVFSNDSMQFHFIIVSFPFPTAYMDTMDIIDIRVDWMAGYPRLSYISTHGYKSGRRPLILKEMICLTPSRVGNKINI